MPHVYSRAGVDVGHAVWIAGKTHLITAQRGEAAEQPRAHFGRRPRRAQCRRMTR
jgi:hypothetical protein